MSGKLRYITVCQSAWCNAEGFGVHYGWDGETFATRKEAIANGFELRESDDFNVAVISGKRLISFDWMDRPVGEDEATMAEIATALGLRFSPSRHQGGEAGE